MYSNNILNEISNIRGRKKANSKYAYKICRYYLISSSLFDMAKTIKKMSIVSKSGDLK